MNRFTHGHKSQGFTLVELMIIITIVTLLSVIVVPNMLRARISANEALAMANLRILNVVCDSYKSSQNPQTYPINMNYLMVPYSTPPYIPERFKYASTKGVEGYRFSYHFENEESYSVTAMPVKNYVTGSKIFYMDETGVIRLNGPSGATLD